MNEESETLSPERIKNRLLSNCNKIGYLDKDQKYIKDVYCEYWLKESLKFLRKDKDCVARKTLGFANIVTNDLIPILKQHCIEDEYLFDISLRLLVMLTNPVLLSFKEEIPEDKDEQKLFMELSSYLYQYKTAFSMDVKLFSIFAKHMARLLRLDWEERQEEHKIMLERILVLIRNILHIPVDPKLEHGTDEDANVHDLCVETMYKSGINDLLLFMANSDTETEFCFHILEILSLMMREQNAEFLAKSVDSNVIDESFNKRNFFEKQKDSEGLRDLLVKDRSLTKLTNATNFNRFKEATYLVKNMKSLSDKDVIFHKTPTDLNSVTFGSQKSKARKAKNRAPLKDETAATFTNNQHFVHRSTVKIRKFLRDFCSSFLMDSYNNIMKTARDSLERKRSQPNDETYYLWTFQFFMEYCRCMKFDPQNVAETLSIESFHYLHTLIEHYSDLLSQEKKKFHAFSRRLHFALKAYRELLFSLATLDKISNPTFRELGNSMKNRVFYEIEYRELLLRLIIAYNPIKLSPSYLSDLIETNHIFLKMLENYCKVNDKVVVKQKQRKKSKKKSRSTAESPEVIWTEISVQITEILQGALQLPTVEENPDVIPVDGTSDKPADEQKLSVMSRIYCMMKSRKNLEAVALYRNAREAWIDDPENPFGNPGITFEEELMNLRDILFDDFLSELNSDVNTSNTKQDDEDTFIDGDLPTTTEKEFLFLDFVKKYMSQKVLITFSSLLQHFEHNSKFTNHCIIKMFHRAAWDNKMHAMFFQLSIFRLFQKVLNYPQDSEDITEITKFAKYIIQRFFEVAKKNKTVFSEFLFWKTSKEAYEVEEGYGTYGTIKTKTGKRRGKKNSEDVTSSDDERDNVERNEELEQPEEDQLINQEHEVNIEQHTEHNEQSELPKDVLLGIEEEDDDDDLALLNAQLKIGDVSDEDTVNVSRRKRIIQNSDSDEGDSENELIINEDAARQDTVEDENQLIIDEGYNKQPVDDEKNPVENINKQDTSEIRKRSDSDDEDGDQVMSILRRKRAKLFESDSDSD
ncbi:Timeless-like protein [Leptotrombidium deliense]|uniref:Timeless-like protein n=1 Tax=Leptotrombidium deliense TaxID=299467 RepID=A0A443SFE4_9ACAR|nr:Timeless-like protein [Leptotrombidium deliense]